MQINSKVTTLLFDFGNVIIDIDFQKTWNALKEVLGKEYENVFDQWQKDSLYKKFEEEKFTAEEMKELINSTYQTSLSVEQVKYIWNALLLNIPKERIELLYRLKKDYNLYLLSNTSYIHIDAIFTQLEKDYPINPITDVFDELFLSYKIGYTKPDTKIYKYVLEKINTEPEECLFFDDLQENLDGATQLNINTQLVTKEQGILELFAGYKA